MKHFFLPLFSATLLLSGMEILPSEAEKIGQGIFFNECGGRKDRLVWWNEGEDFASLGIGHFIWYPEGKKGLYNETFPSLLAFFEKQQVAMPSWLKGIDGCPWKNKEAFSDPGQEERKRELQDLLLCTVSLQTTFIGIQFEKAMQSILSAMNGEKLQMVIKKIESLKGSLQGKFALIDYLNFKGAGTSETERYQGKGWGLKQVLEEMPVGSKDPLQAFAHTAKLLLKTRVENAPPKKNEERWLPGWLNRIDRYLKS